MKTTGARSTHQDMGVPGPHVAEPGREKNKLFGVFIELT